MKKCRVFFDDGSSKTIIKLQDNDAETWRLLFRDLVKESRDDAEYEKYVEDECKYFEGWQRWSDEWHDKLTCFVPSEFHEDIFYYPLKRIETL